MKIKYTKNYFNNLISIKHTLKDAIQLLDKTDIKVLFVLDDLNKLIGSITDGDIRRAIISGEDIESELECVLHVNPIVMMELDSDEAKRILKKKDIKALPVVSDDNEVMGIYYVDNRLDKQNNSLDCPVVIMAGGKGTRLLPYTKVLPKPLIPIEGIPIIERIIAQFEEEGCSDFFVVVNHKKEMIKAYFTETKKVIKFVEENIPLGTAGGIKLLSGKISSTFILSNCDVLILESAEEMLRLHKEKEFDATVVCSLKEFSIPYGTVEYNDDGEITQFNEKPTFSYFTNTGYYILEPCVMDYIGENESIGVPEVLERMKADGKRIGMFPVGEGAWLDMGQFDSMESMERRIREMGI